MDNLHNKARDELQLPELTKASHLIRLVVFAQMLALLLALAPNTEYSFLTKLGVISLFVQWVALVSGVLFTQLKRYLRFLTLTQFAFAVQGILLSVTLFCSLLGYGIFHEFSLSSELLKFSLNNLIIAFIIGLVIIQFLLMYDELTSSINAQHQAKFSALQARIRPHFLFNSLNTVAELIHTDQQEAEQALLNLAALFRAAMTSAEKISLEAELALCQQYLSLEQWRLGTRLQVNWQLPSDLPALSLPALTIQPLLENAIQYGFETRTQTGVLDIVAYIGKKQLSFVIENPIAQHHKKQHKNGIALGNIRARLHFCFGKDAELITTSQESLYRVKLVLPLEQPL